MRLGNVWAGTALLAIWTAAAPIQGDGLPSGGPAPLYAPEALLPAPAGWGFGEEFPRTSGVGRYANGAYFWSDFLYDDNGAVGAGPPTNESVGAPSFGTYKYPGANQGANGADLFRVAVAADAANTWWRVDWNTLIDADVPVAEFAIDLDANTGTGGLIWPANAGIRSAGIERALVVSSRGAWLHDASSPLPAAPLSVVAAGGAVFIDAAARSFVVRLPRAVFDPSGVSSVYVAAGLANATGDGFLSLDPTYGANPGSANVYNAAFRDYGDEDQPGA